MGHPGLSLCQKGYLGGVPVPRSMIQGCPCPQKCQLGGVPVPGAGLGVGGHESGRRSGPPPTPVLHRNCLASPWTKWLLRTARGSVRTTPPRDTLASSWVGGSARHPLGLEGCLLHPPAPSLNPCLTDGELYSATFNNFLGTEPVILRNLGPHYSMKTEYLTSWLNGRGGGMWGSTTRAPLPPPAWRYPPLSAPPPLQSPTSWLRLTCRRARPAAPGMTTRFTSSSASGRWSTTATRNRWWPAWRGSARYGEGTIRAGDAVPAWLRSAGERGGPVLMPAGCPGGRRRCPHAAEEVDDLPEGSLGVLGARAAATLQPPPGCLHLAGGRLAGHHLFRGLPGPLVSAQGHGSPGVPHDRWLP